MDKKELDNDMKQWAEDINYAFKNCESQKYIDKYRFYDFDLEKSQSLKKFILLIYNLENDVNENLKINFDLYKKLCFGREYIRYELTVQGNTTYKDIFIQIPYNEYSYKNGLLFTIANVFIEIYRDTKFLTSEIKEEFKKLTEQAYQDFAINKK